MAIPSAYEIAGTHLLEAFELLGTGGELEERHRSALLAHLKATLPKAERKRMRDVELVETIARFEEMGLELYSEQYGAINLAADLFRISSSTAARVWEESLKTSGFE